MAEDAGHPWPAIARGPDGQIIAHLSVEELWITRLNPWITMVEFVDRMFTTRPYPHIHTESLNIPSTEMTSYPQFPNTLSTVPIWNTLDRRAHFLSRQWCPGVVSSRRCKRLT